MGKICILTTILFLIVLLNFGCGKATNTSNLVNINTSQSPSEPPKQLITPLIDFFSLVGKTPAEIEKIYEKPSYFDTKIIQLKQTGGKFGVYDKSGKRYLQVDYYSGKAVAFYLEIPANLQTKSPEETLKICGLNIQISDANTEKDGFWWESPSGAKPFYRTRITRYNDSGLYYNCEAHIKVN